MPRARWPMIVLRSPKGWTGPTVVDGLPVEGTFRAHQVPLLVDAEHPEHVQQLDPLTAVMIVMLALLSDGAILSIAYDNVHDKNAPEAWNMRLVLGIATVLGIVGPIAAFGLFFLSDRVFHIDRPHIQTMMYLMLSVAGHLTIFQTRTRGPFWSIRPARILWMAVLGTHPDGPREAARVSHFRSWEA